MIKQTEHKPANISHSGPPVPLPVDVSQLSESNQAAMTPAEHPGGTSVGRPAPKPFQPTLNKLLRLKDYLFKDTVNALYITNDLKPKQKDPKRYLKFHGNTLTLVEKKPASKQTFTLDIETDMLYKEDQPISDPTLKTRVNNHIKDLVDGILENRTLLFKGEHNGHPLWKGEAYD